MNRINSRKFEIDHVIPTLPASILYPVEIEGSGLSHDVTVGGLRTYGGKLLSQRKHASSIKFLC